MQNDIVANDAIVPNRDGKAGIGVQRAIVLDLRALAQFDPLVISSQNRAEPNTGVALETHAADDNCTVSDP